MILRILELQCIPTSNTGWLYWIQITTPSQSASNYLLFGHEIGLATCITWSLNSMLLKAYVKKGYPHSVNLIQLGLSAPQPYGAQWPVIPNLLWSNEVISFESWEIKYSVTNLSVCFLFPSVKFHYNGTQKEKTALVSRFLFHILVGQAVSFRIDYINWLHCQHSYFIQIFWKPLLFLIFHQSQTRAINKIAYQSIWSSDRWISWIHFHFTTGGHIFF